jgi:hypothetical protein
VLEEGVIEPAGSRAEKETSYAVLGTDGTVGGPGGSPLLSSVASNSATVDVCRQFGATPGTDITKTLQEAIEAITALGGGTVYFSKPGIYLLEGAQTTGTAFGHAYSGQVLFPARAQAEKRITIRIAGVAPVAKPMLGSGAELSQNVGGVVLKSNATSGKVFDVIPGEAGVDEFAGGPRSDLLLIFEDLTVQVPPNPQTWAIDTRAATRVRGRGVSIEPDPAGGVGASELPTGAAFGWAMPWAENAGHLRLEDVSICGYATGLGISEHVTLANVFIGECAVAIEGYGAGHLNVFANVNVEENVVTLRARSKAESEAAKIVAAGQSGAQILGSIAFENVATNFLKAVALIEDPESLFRGFLQEGGNSRYGKPIVGGLTLDAAEIRNGGTGWKTVYPRDDWKRNPRVAGNLGTCDRTRHPWRIKAGKFNPEGAEGGSLKQGESALCRAVVPYVRRVGNGTRSIIATVVVGKSASSSIGLILNEVGAGTNVGHSLLLRFREGKMLLRLEPAATVLAEAAVAAEKTYEVTVILTCNPFGVPTKVQVFLGTEQKLEYSLSEAQQAALVDTQALEAWDGIYINNDSESSFSVNAQGVGFQVQPA